MEFINSTTMTLNIKRRKSIPRTAAIFQRGLSKKTGKGVSVKKKKSWLWLLIFSTRSSVWYRKRIQGSPEILCGRKEGGGGGEELPAKHCSVAHGQGECSMRKSSSRGVSVSLQILVLVWTWDLTRAWHVLSTKLQSQPCKAQVHDSLF